MNIKKPLLWKACLFSIFGLCLLTFTPWVIPEGVMEPWLWGLPRTLWAGILISISLIICIVLATFALGEDESRSGS